MQHVDGNALAGPLAEFFAFDMTTAAMRCNGCGSVAELARAMVYTTGMGSVVRCDGCGQVLATLVESNDRAWLGFSGVSAIQVRREA